MKFLFVILILGFLSTPAYADLNDCKNLYVGRISVKAGGLERVVFLTDPKNSSGSYWVYFANFEDQGKNAALSLLTAAKLSGHRLDLYTSAANGCDVSKGPMQAVDLHLANFK